MNADGPDLDRDMLHVDEYLWLKMGLMGCNFRDRDVVWAEQAQLTGYRG